MMVHHGTGTCSAFKRFSHRRGSARAVLTGGAVAMLQGVAHADTAVPHEATTARVPADAAAAIATPSYALTFNTTQLEGAKDSAEAKLDELIGAGAGALGITPEQFVKLAAAAVCALALVSLCCCLCCQRRPRPAKSKAEPSSVARSRKTTVDESSLLARDCENPVPGTPRSREGSVVMGTVYRFSECGGSPPGRPRSKGAVFSAVPLGSPTATAATTTKDTVRAKVARALLSASSPVPLSPGSSGNETSEEDEVGAPGAGASNRKGANRHRLEHMSILEKAAYFDFYSRKNNVEL